jgi:hypothetical protein
VLQFEQLSLLRTARMQLRVHHIDCYRIDMHTRFPFRYGIASMTELPHLVVSAAVEVDGDHCNGVAADGLPPKWFTKNPSTRFEQDDLPAMLRVIRHAADRAVELASQRSLFAWWWELYQAQQAWASEQNVPSLLAGFGTSLIERAVIDAVCRKLQITLFDALQTNVFEIELATIRPALGSCRPVDVLPDQPQRSVQLRHTVGLGDPLTDGEIEEQVDDGLPHSLVANIREYGLKYFKIKLCGDAQLDGERMSNLAAILAAEVGAEMRFTLDGNEQYDDISAFRDCWQRLRSIEPVKEMIDRSLLFVEQPLHRSRALEPSVKQGIEAWSHAPPIIIDESDADLSSLPTALQLGYSGTSHKNCKGILKSVAAAATIAQAGAHATPLIQSAEDLANVGPVALLQDLAMVAALGIPHVERNGHHYFAGLSMYPRRLQEQVVSDHGDLYRWHDRGFAALAPSAGRLDLTSVNRAPFGLAQPPDLSCFQPWSF